MFVVKVSVRGPVLATGIKFKGLIIKLNVSTYFCFHYLSP